MRQASWEELFRQGDADEKEGSRWWRLRFLTWEDLVTLFIVFIAFFTVTASIDGADWVAEMPSLFSTSYLGLFLGVILAKTRLKEPFAHLIALVIGVVAVTLNSSSELQGSLPDRLQQLQISLESWLQAATSGGISNDDLPFVVLVVAATYLTAYISAWAIFRWMNPWVGLVPGGLALLTNISYLPGQNGAPLLVYLFCGILLVSRVNLLRRAREWQRNNTGYPDFISLHVLNVTVWVAVGLLAMAWILPVGSGSGKLYSLWRSVTAPIVEPFGDMGRLFSSIDSKKGSQVHRFGSTMPLQGEITLGSAEVMSVTAAEPGFLRGQSYDFYTAQGWKVGPSAQITSDDWPAAQQIETAADVQRELRRAVAIDIQASRTAGVFFSMGEPLAVSVDSKVVFGPDQSDVTSIRPTGRLNQGDQYRVDSSISNATVARLRQSALIFPTWIDPYLQLPEDLPERIRERSIEVTEGATNPYDQAVLIEQYLRTFAVDLTIDPAPPRRDSVDYFLFDLGRGYFDYHASAMVVMLRTLGIPARLSVGYTLQNVSRLPDSNTYVVRESNAFAWPEVYFSGLGWVEFNPTPSEPLVARTGSDDAVEIPLEEDPFFGTGVAPGDVAPAAPVIDEFVVEEESNLVSRIVLGVVLAFAAVSIVGFGAFQYAWQHGLGGLPYPQQIWEKTLRLARWTKLRAVPQETPRDLNARLHALMPQVQDLDFLTESYLRSRYGQKELKPEEQDRLTEVWKQVRNTLLGRMLKFR